MRFTKTNLQIRSSADSENIISLILVLSCLALFAFSWHMASIRPVWCDEVFTYFQIQGETWSSFAERTTSGLNRMPPLYFAICKLLFGHLEDPIFACRMLSSIFMCGSIIFLYLFLRFDLPQSWAASLAVAVTLPSDFFLSYCYEARPYGAAHAAMVLFLWLIRRSEEQTHSKKILAVLGLLCLLAPSFHYTFAISTTIIGCAHLVTTTHSRKRLFMIYTISGVIFALFNIPLIIEQAKFGNILAIIPYASLSVAKDFLAMVIPPATCLLLLALTTYGFCIVSRRLPEKTDKRPLPRLVFAMLIAFAIIPTLGFVGSRIVPNFWFLPRYYLSTLLIPAFLFLPTLYHLAQYNFSKLSRTIPLWVCVLTSLVSLNTHAREFDHLFKKPQDYSYALLPDSSLQEVDVPIITNDLILWFCYHYAGIQSLHYYTSDYKQSKHLKSYLPGKLILQDLEGLDNFLYIKTVGHALPRFELKNYHVINRNDYHIDPVHKILEFERKF